MKKTVELQYENFYEEGWMGNGLAFCHSVFEKVCPAVAKADECTLVISDKYMKNAKKISAFVTVRHPSFTYFYPEVYIRLSPKSKTIRLADDSLILKWNILNYKPKRFYVKVINVK